jgi:polyhydroxybutyrate depolymerase
MKNKIRGLAQLSLVLVLMVGFQNCDNFESLSEQTNAPSGAAPVNNPPPANPITPAPLGKHVVQTRIVSDGSQNRSYIVYLPSDYASRTTQAQIVMGFHPGSNSAEQFQNIARLHEQAGAENHIIVYPDGDESPGGNQAWNVGFCCTGADDLAFFDAMLVDLASLTKIKSKVAVTGYSSGAMMVYRLLCSRSDKILAAVPFAAYLRKQDVTNTTSCVWGGTIPVLHLHGAEDAQMNINGQADAYYPNSGIQTPPLLEYLDTIAVRNGGKASSVSEVYDADLDSLRVKLNANTYYVIIDQQGHTWPGEVGFGKYGPGRLELEGTKAVMKFLFEQR